MPTLQSLASSSAFDVALVVTQAAKGTSPVEVAANGLGLPVYKPETLRDPASREPLIAAEADLFVVAAFGLIFRQRTLDIPRHGSINVHPSLLPKYRGASPIVAAIAAGDRETGVALMVMDTGIDTGAVISQERAAIADEDTSESLGGRWGALAPNWLFATSRVGSRASWFLAAAGCAGESDAHADQSGRVDRLDEASSRNRAAHPRHVAMAAAWTTVHGSPIADSRAPRLWSVEHGVREPGVVISERRKVDRGLR